MGRSVALFLAVFCAAAVLAGEAAKGDLPEFSFERIPPTPIAKPDHVIGNGTPESVTEAALEKAFAAKGGSIVFNTGGRPVTLAITKTLYLPVNSKPTILDGGGLVTLDGCEKTRIIQKAWKTELTVQRLKFINARTEKSGAVINVENYDGRLSVIDCQFENCKTTSEGPDIGGGAIRAPGQKHFLISGCNFNNCAGSNGGAVNSLGCQLTIIGCSFTNNIAFGKKGGADRGPEGQGGIGGAVYMDGCSQNADKPQLLVADCFFKDNHANDHAGAIFAFTRPEADSNAIFHACIFENSTVSDDACVAHGGAIYSQHGNGFYTYCTFSNNKTPKIGGAVFMAVDRKVRIANCEFYGNKGRGGLIETCSGPKSAVLENNSLKQLPQPPAMALLGRLPGWQAPKSKETAKTEPQKNPDVPPPLKKKAPEISVEIQKAWTEKLKARVREVLAAKRPPQFALSKPPATITINSLADDGNMQITMDQNMQTSMKWDKLGRAEHESLAVYLADHDGTPADSALAAFFLLLAESTERADKYLDKAGEQAKEVMALFKAVEK
jgi:hypothetical protein